MKIKSAHVLDLVQVENEKEEEKKMHFLWKRKFGPELVSFGPKLKGGLIVFKKKKKGAHV